MDQSLASRLIALAAHDRATRARLASHGSLFEGYHPEMQAVHEANAQALETIIDAIGWPIADRVGESGAEATWLIAQHAIGLPPFQRRCLGLLEAAVAQGQAPAWQMAMMFDRICVFEGRAQRYGSQFDWGDDGQFSPLPIDDPDGVDRRRAEVGLEPLAAAIANHREQTEAGAKPADLASRRKRIEEWAQRVGWR
ncbi:hypothetical protein OKW76_11170 [Sphingomonas sp. S1-29]|uniref:DUF6624 domain-containing protein n=1 Tax=Sphingomonas sp. S1-29 TaxID=2991074 RepID=UPI0022409C24|nr:DUF6624 domain-containing protein [Sphingomonas sp. S1-29]UZK68607.1 hypothetical protein OKW76_11170 [Sphingomonas sp. S1-29]